MLIEINVFCQEVKGYHLQFLEVMSPYTLLVDGRSLVVVVVVDPTPPTCCQQSNVINVSVHSSC